MATGIRVATLLLLLAVVLHVQQGLWALSQEARPGSIGMTGSFYTLRRIVVPQGGVVNSSDVFVVVYNYGDASVKVKMSYDAPENVTVLFDPGETEFTLEPGGYRKMRVVIVVGENALPGVYDLYVYANHVVEGGEGVALAPGVAQSIKIEVTGRYSTLTVYALDPGGEIADMALIRLYANVSGRMVSLYDSYGVMERVKVLPGRYEVRVYLSGELVASQVVELAPMEDKVLRLQLKIVYFELFTVKPVMAEDKLIAARIIAVVKNLYKTLHNVDIKLVVYRDGNLLEERTIVSSSILPEGRSEYKIDYVPPDGWKSGNYTMYMEVYGFNNRLLARSDASWIYLEPSLPEKIYTAVQSNPLYIITVVIPLILLLILARRRRGQRQR